MTEQERAKAAASVQYYRRALEAAERAVEGARDKVSKYQDRLEGAKADLAGAEEELADIRNHLAHAEALFDGDVAEAVAALTGESSVANAGTATGSGEGGL